MSRFSVVMKRLALLSPPPSNCHTFYNVKRSSPTVAGGRRRLIKGSLSAADTLAPVPTLHLTGPRPLEGKFILRFRRRPSFSLSFCLFHVCVSATLTFSLSLLLVLFTPSCGLIGGGRSGRVPILLQLLQLFVVSLSLLLEGGG